MTGVLLLCGSTSYFADDVHITCAICGTPIVRRPHGPVDAVTICEACFVKQVAIEPLSEIAVSEETLREVALYQTKTKGTQ